MWIKFEGGSELQRRWFLEAARSLEGPLSWGEVWSHPAFRHWLPVIEGFPIFEQRVMVTVDWTGDPAPSLHNEWAYTENTQTTWERVGNALVAGSPNEGAVFHTINNTDTFGAWEDLDEEFVVPTSTIRIKQDLHTKGEELYKYVVRHELGHVIMHSLTDEEKWGLAFPFGVHPGSEAEGAEWFAGEGLTWANKGKEAIAETVADAFFLGPHRGPGRYKTNRTRFRLQSETDLPLFVSLLAPKLGGFTDIFTPVGHPRHPYAQNNPDPPESSSREDPAFPLLGMQVSFDWTDPPEPWTEQMFPIGGPDPTVVWRHHFISGGERLATTPIPVDPSVDEVTEYWKDLGASGTVVVEFNQLPGGVCSFQIGFTDEDLATEFPVNLLPHIFERQRFDGTGLDAPPYIPGTTNGNGEISFEIHDASGRPCWLPYDTLIGTDNFPIAERWQTILDGSAAPGSGEVIETVLGEDGVIDAGHGPLEMGFWLHDPRVELEPQLAGTSLEAATFGEPVYRVRPDCSTLELPLRISLSVSESGSYGSGLGEPIRAPKPYVMVFHMDAFSHQSPPAWSPPWPYRGEIHAEPAPPGSKPNKPVYGAPAPAIVVSNT